MNSLAVVTMVYNEAELLPVWLRYYAGQVGASHCYIVDHGSDDGSTKYAASQQENAANLIRLPRSPQDDQRRALFISRLCAALLGYYDAVLYTDVDEIAVAQPGLLSFAASSAQVSTAVGLNVIHAMGEGPIDPARPIGVQRHYAAFSSALCKPVLIRRPVTWAPGFHSVAEAAPLFEGLYLFHLRYCDRAIALARLSRTRAMPWADQTGGAHQRVDDAAFTEMLNNFATMDRRDETVVSLDTPPLAEWLDSVRASQLGREHQTYRIDLHLNAYELWPIPDNLRRQF
jgi:hypothetical protein